jgi:AraC-like DNA-binding protein
MNISILMVRVLIEALERVGVSRDQFLKAADLDPTILDERNARFSLTEYNRVQLAALELSGDEALGLHIGEQSRSTAFDLLGDLTDHASTLRQGIETIICYQGILSDIPAPTLNEQGEKALIWYEFPGFDSPGNRLISELAMSGYLRFIRMFVGPKARPHGVFFAYKAPSYRGEYERVFAGTERFEHEVTGIEFERVWLDRAQLFKNPELYSVLQGHAERALGRLTRDGDLTDVVLERLALTDPKKMPLMKDVARHFGMSARSLRRRLGAEGAGYTDLIKQAQTAIAKRMLENPHTSIHETAYAMGFDAPAAFHRAFKRWTGMTPKQYKSSY